MHPFNNYYRHIDVTSAALISGHLYDVNARLNPTNSATYLRFTFVAAKSNPTDIMRMMVLPSTGPVAAAGVRSGDDDMTSRTGGLRQRSDFSSTS